jgi:hypothetical protein
MRPLVALELAVVATTAGCVADPVHDSMVQGLPPEVPGVPAGELHRAGQPCLACHGGEGPASERFVIAGTVFRGPGLTAPATGFEGAQVLLEDDSQARFTATTNCVGNFLVKPTDWPGHPQFPVMVRVVGRAGGPSGPTFDVAMQSHVGRAGSCADCHELPTAENLWRTPGLVHLAPNDDPQFKGSRECPVSPIPSQL